MLAEVRVLDTPDELLASYRLRYAVYRGMGYVPRRRSELDVDPYDAWAVPFGAFSGSGELIGTLRLISQRPHSVYQAMVRAALAIVRDPALDDAVLRPPLDPLPSLFSSSANRQIAQFNTDRLPVRELSRTIVHHHHRGDGVSRCLMELGLAYAARDGHVVLVGSCLPHHAEMYARYGYVPAPDPCYAESVGRVATLVMCRTDALPPLTRAHVDELLSAMAQGGAEHTLSLGRSSPVRVRFTPRM